MPSFDEVVGVMLDTCGLVMKFAGYRGACRRQRGHEGLHVSPMSDHVLLVNDYSGPVGDLTWTLGNPMPGYLMVRQDIPSPRIPCYGPVDLPSVTPVVVDGQLEARLQQKHHTVLARCCLEHGHSVSSGDLCLGKIILSNGETEAVRFFPDMVKVPQAYVSRVIDSDGRILVLPAIQPTTGVGSP